VVSELQFQRCSSLWLFNLTTPMQWLPRSVE